MTELQHFADFLQTVSEATNETQKREAFVTLCARGFQDSQLAKSLALGAEFKVRFQERGLLRRGSVDSLFGNLVLEFEFNLSKTLPHAEEQLRGYCAGAWTEEASAARPYLAVATDGASWRVYVPRVIDETCGLDSSNIELRFLEGWGATGAEGDTSELHSFLNRLLFRQSLLVPSARNITRDFGVGSAAYIRARDVFLRKLTELAADPQKKVLQGAWHSSLQAAYGELETTDELFAQHTYLAILAKLMVWSALERRALKSEELASVLDGMYFKERMIANMVENDYFRWYEINSETEIGPSLVAIANQLGSYDMAAVSEDILKPLYEQLVDQGTRKALGEFYTPDWLANRVALRLLESHKWSDGPPRVLDPACGSGTFLRAVIETLRARTSHELQLDAVLGNVVGIDVHPLAVAIARATYLLAIQDIVGGALEAISIPVYLANSLSMPTIARQYGLYGDSTFELRIDDTSYAVPAEFVMSGIAYDEAIEEVMVVARAFGRRDHEASDVATSLAASLAGRLQAMGDSGELVSTLGRMASHIARLISERRDSVHGFMLKNHYRPSMLRGTFDYVIGNPPWLTVGDVRDARYKDKIVERCRVSRIASRAMGEQRHTEIAVLFLVAAFDDFLRTAPRGSSSPRAAFVMPRSLFTATHHKNLRQGLYTSAFDPVELWDLDGVAPLFNIPACVVFAADRKAHPEEAKRGYVLEGRLPHRDIAPAEAESAVSTTEMAIGLKYLGKRSAWTTGMGSRVANGDGLVATPYSSMFRQGAVLYPQMVVFMEVEDTASLRRRRVVVRTDSRVVGAAKKRTKMWNGHVETASLFSTLAPDNLVPFANRGKPFMVVLPVLGTPSDGRLDPVGPSELRSAGRIETASWLEWAQEQWSDVRDSKSSEEFLDRLDFMRQLTCQKVKGEFVVMYAAAGRRPVAAALRRDALPLPFIARDRTYVRFCESEHESHYLATMLNSDFVATRIEAWINRGLFGLRDINKRALDVPWPLFDLNNELHVQLASAGAQLCRDAHEALETGAPHGLGRARTWIRERLSAEVLREVEVLVEEVAALSGGR